MVQFTPEEMPDCPECGVPFKDNTESTRAKLTVGGTQPFDDSDAVVRWCSECGYVWDVGKATEYTTV